MKYVIVFTCYFLLCLLVSCEHTEKFTSNTCVSESSVIYENDSVTMGLVQTTLVVDSFLDGNIKRIIRLYIEDGKDSIFTIDINSNNIPDLKEFIKLCDSYTLHGSQHLLHYIDGEPVFSMNQDGLYCKEKENMYVDMRISVPEFLSILEPVDSIWFK